MREKILPLMKIAEAELKELKKELRDPERQPPVLRTYYKIADQKWRATLMYCAIAAGRKRVHRQKDTLEEQQEFLNKHFEKSFGDLLEDKAA